MNIYNGYNIRHMLYNTYKKERAFRNGILLVLFLVFLVKYSSNRNKFGLVN